MISLVLPFSIMSPSGTPHDCKTSLPGRWVSHVLAHIPQSAHWLNFPGMISVAEDCCTCVHKPIGSQTQACPDWSRPIQTPPLDWKQFNPTPLHKEEGWLSWGKSKYCKEERKRGIGYWEDNWCSLQVAHMNCHSSSYLLGKYNYGKV